MAAAGLVFIVLGVTIFVQIGQSQQYDPDDARSQAKLKDLHASLLEVRLAEGRAERGESDVESDGRLPSYLRLARADARQISDLVSDQLTGDRSVDPATLELVFSYLDTVNRHWSQGESSRSRSLEAFERAIRAVEVSEATLRTRLFEQSSQAKRTTYAAFGASVIFVLFSLIVGARMARRAVLALRRDLERLSELTTRIGEGDVSADVDSLEVEEVAALRESIAGMQDALKLVREEVDAENWLKTGHAQMGERLAALTDLDRIAEAAVQEAAQWVDAAMGAVFMQRARSMEEVAATSDASLSLSATYAYRRRKHLKTEFKRGEGLVGQAFQEGKILLLDPAPEDYIQVESGLGRAKPSNILVVPVVVEDNVVAVVELARVESWTATELEYMRRIVELLASAMEVAFARRELVSQRGQLEAQNVELEQQTRQLEQAQAELEQQRNELREAQKELQSQVTEVEQSEQELREQRNELEQRNAELRDKNDLLAAQKQELAEAREKLTRRAYELAQASNYKSEFLANMSHELRTPLNSVLILADDLRRDTSHTLTEDQIEAADVIYRAGSDLLDLINEILDLSKIEAGAVVLKAEAFGLESLFEKLYAQFKPLAEDKAIELVVEHPEQGIEVVADRKRVDQVVKNLLGNAIKFTHEGRVTLKAGLRELDEDEPFVEISVVDTGIGIPEEQQERIFGAFEQVESGDRRSYGGTGLGLAISRKLVHKMGGTISLESTPEEGSAFHVRLPLRWSPSEEPEDEPLTRELVDFVEAVSDDRADAYPELISAPRGTLAPEPHLTDVYDDDRDLIDGDDTVILLIEDDVNFGRMVVRNIRERGMRCVAATHGAEGLEQAKVWMPDGIILDLILPDMDGWAVLRELKADVGLRHIPVHIVSARDPDVSMMRMGAVGHETKPLRQEDVQTVLDRLRDAGSDRRRAVLVVEDDAVMRQETVTMISSGNVVVDAVATGAEALALLGANAYDLVILDLGLPDMTGTELLESAGADASGFPPVIIYTLKDLTESQELALRRYADRIILKDVRSQERLIDEVALFLHRIVNDLPSDKRRVIRHLHRSDKPLEGKTVLIVEDDMRTMFAMTRLLAEHGVEPIKAENGARGIEMIEDRPDIDLVLLDMMMPVMNGYETLKAIRSDRRTKGMPVIALTAKAMAEDRQECIEAGADDYLSKPVDPEQLLSLLRVWLCR